MKGSICGSLERLQTRGSNEKRMWCVGSVLGMMMIWSCGCMAKGPVKVVCGLIFCL